MRINKLLALATGMSRRAADEVIASGRLTIGGRPATPGQHATPTDSIALDGRPIDTSNAFDSSKRTTIMLNKPAGYVVSRKGQGSKIVYELLPDHFGQLKPIGRLDKDSSGLLLMTDDGTLANELTHPSRRKRKVYEAELDKLLSDSDKVAIERGVMLDDGLSHLILSGQGKAWNVAMYEGRNRQIRRTFAALGYRVQKLHRIQFGPYELGSLAPGRYVVVGH